MNGSKTKKFNDKERMIREELMGARQAGGSYADGAKGQRRRRARR